MGRDLRATLPPGPRIPSGLQLLGTWMRPTATLERLRRYGRRVTVRLPFQPPFVILSDPADIKALFTAPADAVHPGEGASILAPIVGRNSVILLDEEIHLAQRRLLLPAFHGERMQRLRGMSPAAEPDGEDIFSTLLAARHEDDSEMSAQELRDELMTALVAGHETTASQLAWALERLSREPDIQARLREEIDAGESDEYLNATITEILRLRPVLPNAEPRLTKREVEINGARYPPGVVLLASAYLVHHDPSIYPEPQAFRPERFLGVTPGTYTWLPFGGGRRRCLGASFALEEMRIALRAVLRRYELEPVGPRGEAARRRSITFSPSRSATVMLRARGPAATAAVAALAPA